MTMQFHREVLRSLRRPMPRLPLRDSLSRAIFGACLLMIPALITAALALAYWLVWQ
jgi:hypothetical protein